MKLLSKTSEHTEPLKNRDSLQSSILKIIEHWGPRIKNPGWSIELQELKIKNWGSSCFKNFLRILKYCTFEKTISFACLHDTCTWLVGIFRIIVQPFNSERKCLKYNIMMNILTSLLLIKNWEKTQTQIKNTFKGWI